MLKENYELKHIENSVITGFDDSPVLMVFMASGTLWGNPRTTEAGHFSFG